MKTKVIIFCVLLFCSKFAVSIPFTDESIQQRAYHQPNNWQGNQNNGEHYHGNGFAQTQNLNPHRHEHSQEFVNQGRQNFDNYGYNNNPLMQQSPPIKVSQVFAAESNERKLDNYQMRGDSLPIRADNQPARVDHQYRQNNWQGQNRPANTATSASASSASASGASSSSASTVPVERPISTVREPYRTPGQHGRYIPPAINHGTHFQNNQAGRINPAVREPYYHPVAESSSNIKYVQQNGVDSESSNRHVHYGNDNDAHTRSTTTNIAKAVNNGFLENSASYSVPVNPQPYERQNVGNHRMRYGLHNTNVPYNIRRPAPSQTAVNNQNFRHIRHPIINSPTNNQPPSNSYEGHNAPNNAGYLDNGPKGQQFTNNYSYVRNPTFNNQNSGRPNTYNDAIGPNYMESDKTDKIIEDNPVIVFGSHYQSPENTYSEPNTPQIDSVLPVREKNPYNKADSSYDETPLSPAETLASEGEKPVEPQPVPSIEPSNSPPADDVHPSKNIYNHFYPGPDRGYMENDPKLKDLLGTSARFVIIHKNGTVQHIDDIDQISQNNQNYIIVKKNDDNESKLPLSLLPPNNSPTFTQPIPNYPESSPTLLPALKDNNLFSAFNNGHPSSPVAQSPNSNENYPSQELPPSNRKDYYPSSIPQAPANPSNEENVTQVTQVPTDDDYNPLTALQSLSENQKNSPPERLHSNKYHPHNQTWDRNYPLSPLQKPAHKFTTSTKAPGDNLLQKLLDSLSNETNPLLEPSFVSSKKDNSKGKKLPPVQLSPNDESNDNQESSEWDISHTTPPSKLPTHTFSGIFNSTTPTPDQDIQDLIESLSAINKSPSPVPFGLNDNDNIKTTIKPKRPYGTNKKKPPGKSTTKNPSDDIPDLNDLQPSSSNKKPHQSLDATDNKMKKPTSEILSPHNKKPSLVPLPTLDKVTTSNPDDDIQEFLDSISGASKKKTTSPPESSTDKNYQKLSQIPSVPQNKHSQKLPAQTGPNSHDKKKQSHEPLSSRGHNKKNLTHIPLIPSDKKNISSSDSLYPKEYDDSQEYNSTKDNGYTTHSPKLHTVISPGIYRSTTSPDDLVQQFVDLFPDKSVDDDTSNSKSDEEDNNHSSLVEKKNSNTTLAASKSHSGSTPNAATIAPVELTTEDTIITISPIELQTDNVRDGPPSNSENAVTTAYVEKSEYISKKKNNTFSPNESEDLDKVFIQIITGDNNKTSELKYKDIQNKNITGPAINDSLAKTDVPVAQNSTEQSVVNTGDNYDTGANLLESIMNTSDVTITLAIPNDSDDNITIRVEVPESAGFEDSSDEETLVVNINTKNCSVADSVIATKANKTTYEGAEENKNLVIDLSNSAIFYNKTDDQDFLDEVISNLTSSVIYVFQIKPQPIIERNLTKTIFANNTVVEEMSETTWQSKDDGSPSVVTTKKIYHQAAKH